ncbi:hypothetical protein F5Y12DRAFT_431017 [Xylaria sp. FL1777]|nr:hypothetical protein F5Y12DRAFT_431017 [Xylaria sp. FL1777]
MARLRPEVPMSPSTSTSASASASASTSASTAAPKRGRGRPRGVKKITTYSSPSIKRAALKAKASPKAAVTTRVTRSQSRDKDEGEDECEDEQEWEVDHVSDVRLVGKPKGRDRMAAQNWQYQVYWADAGKMKYPAPTWEPAENLSAAAIHEFWATKYLKDKEAVSIGDEDAAASVEDNAAAPVEDNAAAPVGDNAAAPVGDKDAPPVGDNDGVVVGDNATARVKEEEDGHEAKIPDSIQQGETIVIDDDDSEESVVRDPAVSSYDSQSEDKGQDEHYINREDSLDFSDLSNIF